MKWHTAKYGESAFNPSKCKHTAVNTHTVNTHPEQRAAIYAAAPGKQLGVRLKEERALYIHSPHLQSLPARDSNSQPFNYESDSLTIRPRLLLNKYKDYCQECVENELEDVPIVQLH